MSDFAGWLNQILIEKNLKPADFARIARIDPGVLSNILNQKRGAGAEICIQIADALEIRAVEVFYRAGLLRSTDIYTDNISLDDLDRQILEAIHSTGTDFKRAVLKTIRTWLVLYNELREADEKKREQR